MVVKKLIHEFMHMHVYVILLTLFQNDLQPSTYFNGKIHFDKFYLWM